MKYFNIYCLFAHFWQSNCYTSEEWQSDDSLPTEEQLEVDRGSFTLKRLGAFVIGDLSCWFLWVLFCFFFFCPHHCVGILPIISLQVWKWKRKLLGFFFFLFESITKGNYSTKQLSLFALLYLIDRESELTVSSEEMWIKVWNALCWFFLYIIYCEW